MASNAKLSAVENGEESTKSRTRSPAYPFVNLAEAITRAEQFFKEEIRGSANLRGAVKHWGYAEKSSGGLQTAAALIAFGLMKDEGTGDKRKLQLTPNAVRMLLDKRSDSPEREQLIKEFALTPKVHRELWEKWGASLPSESQLRYTLTAEWEPPFNEKAVDVFIAEYRDTIAFAKLLESDRLGTENGTGEDAGGKAYVPKIGDYVQWESQGTLHFKKPVRVLSITADGSHAFVEGTTTGLPVNQLHRAETPPTQPQPQIQRTPLLPTTTVQEDVYSVPEGRLIVQWPTVLSSESVQQIKEYLKLLERKIVLSTAKDTGKPE